MIYNLMNVNATAAAQFSKYGIKYLYHMTHKKNLPSILEHGLINHYNAHSDGYNKKDIASRKVMALREEVIIPDYCLPVTSFVPFYFRIKNAMLYAIAESSIQDDIVILCYDPNLLLKEETVYTDGNAACKGTKFFSDISDLNKLDWKCLNARYWGEFPDGKRKKMAEVLVGYKVSNKYLQKICCNSYNTYSMVKKTLLHSKFKPEVEINRSLYF